MLRERLQSLTRVAERRPCAVVATAVLVSFALRVAIVLLRGTWAADYSDSDIGRIANNIASGRGFLFMGFPSSFFGPVFLYLWAFALKAGGETGQLVIQIFQAALLSAASLFLYRFARLRFAALPAVGGALLFAFYPELLVLPTTMYADTVALALWCACLALYAAAVRPGSGTITGAIALGLAAGVTALTKGRLLLFTGLLLPFLAAGDPSRLRGLLRPTPGGLRAALLAGLAIAVVLAPWVVRNHRVHGEFLLLESSVGLNLWMGHNENATGTGKAALGVGGAADPELGGTGGTAFPRSPELLAAFQAARSELARDRVLRRAALHAIRENPAREVPLSLRKILYFWTIDPTSGVARSPAYWIPWGAVLLLAIVGIRNRWSEGKTDPLLLAILGFATVLAVVFFVIPRLRYPIYPVVFLFAGQGMARLLDTVTGARHGGSAAGADGEA